MSLTIDGKVASAAKVVSFDRTTVRVSSDHAWLDSGNRLRVTYWDGKRSWTEEHCTDDRDIDVQGDTLDEAERRALDKWRQVYNWVGAGVAARHEHDNRQREIRKGDEVEVFKGRKCPKGSYRVAFAGENDYGKYLHLVDLDGREGYYRFIDPSNCRKQPQPFIAEVPSQWGMDRTLRDLAGAVFSADMGYYGRQTRAQAFLVLADRFDELGFADEANALRHLPEITERKLYNWELEAGKVGKGDGWVSLAD